MVHKLFSIALLCLPASAFGMGENNIYIPKGLVNQRNACFINASLQALHASVDLVSMALEHGYYLKPGSLSALLRDCAIQLRTAQSSSIGPAELHTSIYAHLGMNEREQGDANDCLATILNHITETDINDEYKPYHPKYKGTQIPTMRTELSELFYVHIRHLRIDPKNEAFIGTKSPEQTIGLSLEVRPEDKTLSNCLDRYFQSQSEHFRSDPDTLIEGANRRFLEETQNYLFIMLDRKEGHRGQAGISYMKEDARISFPLNKLDLSPYFLLKERSKGPYELIAVIMHCGNADGGHYTTYSKLGNQWYFCDDAAVTPVSEESMTRISQQGSTENGSVATTFIYELSSARPTYSTRSSSSSSGIYNLIKLCILNKK